MPDGRLYAWCNEDGLISIADTLPSGVFQLSEGDERDMNIVRQLAHKDGSSYWVPGVFDTTKRAEHLHAFCDACCAHMDDGPALIPLEKAEDNLGPCTAQS